MVGTVALRAYYTCLAMFAFVSHPVSYCFFLLACVASVSGFLFSSFGFSWYLILLGLVYVGGVYVLFIFISVFVPKTSPQLGGSLFLSSFFFLFFSCVFV